MKQDALVPNTAKLGKELMAEAQERLLGRMREAVRSEFDYVLLRIEQHTKERDSIVEHLIFFHAKHEALEKGKFTLTTSGQLIMNDPELQRQMADPNNHESRVRR